jgi:hypothetical protein
MRCLLPLLLIASACGDDGGSSIPDAPATACALPDTTADLGTLPALKAQRCNVSGSMGQQKWFRLSATMTTGDIVQLELWPGSGPFTGAVTTGMFPVDTAFGSCGVCLRAIGDKGAATQKEYFATGGMVNITALGANGQPISATVTSAVFAEVDATHAKVPSGCTATVAKVQVDGTVMDVTGGGSGTGACPTTVGD